MKPAFHRGSRGQWLAAALALAFGLVIRAGADLRAETTLSVTADARAMQPGEVVLLTVRASEPGMSLTAVTARAFDHALSPYRVNDTTWCVLAGIDLDVAPGRYSVTVAARVAGAAEAKASYTLVVLGKSFPRRTLTVDPAFVTPPASEQARITSEGERLAALWALSTPTRLWDGTFRKPVAEPANSAFGSRSVFNGQLQSPHTGADFLSPAGTPVHAPAGGRVVVASLLYYSGNTVVLDHGLGLYSLFAHFSRIDVHEGDVVTPGQILGLVGATGRVTGPHLHWAVRVSGARVDPLSLVAVLEAWARTRS